jgi:hypothetical protein
LGLSSSPEIGYFDLFSNLTAVPRSQQQHTGATPAYDLHCTRLQAPLHSKREETQYIKGETLKWSDRLVGLHYIAYVSMKVARKLRPCLLRTSLLESRIRNQVLRQNRQVLDFEAPHSLTIIVGNIFILKHFTVLLSVIFNVGTSIAMDGLPFGRNVEPPK